MQYFTEIPCHVSGRPGDSTMTLVTGEAKMTKSTKL